MRRISVAIALVVGLVGVGLLMACRHSVNVKGFVRGNKGGPHTYVTLETQPDGSCKATSGVGTLGGKWKAKLTWHLTNNCTTAQYVRVMHYQEYRSADEPDPTKLRAVDDNIVDPTPADSNRLDPGDDDKKLEAHIKKDNTGSGKDILYKYWICVGSTPGPTTNCLDPDVDIWP